MRKSDLRPVPRTEPTGGVFGGPTSDGKGGKTDDGPFANDDLEIPGGESKEGDMLPRFFPSLVTDQNRYKALLHLATWIVAVVFAILAFAITRTKFATEAGETADLPGWFVMVHSVAFFFLLAGVVCVVVFGSTFRKPFKRPLLMAGTNGLLLASLPLYTVLIPTAAHWYEVQAGAAANVTVPAGGDTFMDTNAEDMAKLRDYQLIVVVLQAFGIAQVAAYMIYSLVVAK